MAIDFVELLDKMGKNPNTSPPQDQTIGEFYKSLPADQAEVVDVVIAASVDDEDLSDTDIPARYDALPDMAKYFIDFVVGGQIATDAEVKHEEALDNFLAHYGVKGMKWGVRKGAITSLGKNNPQVTAYSKIDRKALKQKVKLGQGTLGEAHMAALKSRGHRIANGLLGDRRFWITQAKILGGTAAGAGIVVAGAGLVAAAAGTAPASASISILAWGIVAVSTGQSAAAATAAVSNLGRAIRGNARIRKSMDELGPLAQQSQQMGHKKVQKTLWKSGSIRKNAVSTPYGVATPKAPPKPPKTSTPRLPKAKSA